MKNKKNFLCNCNKDYTCEEIGKPEIISVYGVMKMSFSSMCNISEELAKTILTDENVDYIARSAEDENGESVDFSCCEYYLVNPAVSEERAISILNNSGMGYELVYAKGEYLLIKDFYNMSNKGVETNIFYTDDYKKSNYDKETSSKMEINF